MSDKKDFEEIARETIDREREDRIGKTAKDDVERLVVDALCRFPNYSAKQIAKKVGVTPTMVGEVKAKYAAEIAARTGRRVRTERKEEAENLWLTDEEKAAHITLDDALQSVQKETCEVISDPLSPRQVVERTVTRAEADDGGVNFVIVDEKKDDGREKAREMAKKSDETPVAEIMDKNIHAVEKLFSGEVEMPGRKENQSTAPGTIPPFEQFWKDRAFALLDAIRACIENGEPVQNKYLRELDMICGMLAMMEDKEDDI